MFESDSMPEASDGRERTANPLDDVSGSDDSGSATPERTASNRMQKSEMSKHAALMAPAGRTLDLAERKWLQDKWFALDTSGDGILQFDETKILLRDLKKKMTDGEIKRAFEDMDTDGCGSVDFDEFYVWFAHQDAEQFAHLMARGAHRKLVQGIAAIGLGMFVPCVIIILVSGPDPREDPYDFLLCLVPLAIINGLLGAAVFMDSYGPVMQAKAQASLAAGQDGAKAVGRLAKSKSN